MPARSGSAVLPPDRAGSPGSLIVSFAGAHLRELGGWIAVADLIRCLGAVGLSEPSVRQALTRLRSRGFLDANRRAGVAGYALTAAGRADLETGDRRIFVGPTARVEDGWVLAVFTVPEADRHRRHLLRNQLSWLGFGSVAPGVWIAPRPLTGPARSLLESAGLDHYVTWFGADTLAPIEPATWWDLPVLQAQYESFLQAYRDRDADPAGNDDRRAFADHLQLLDCWRLFPRTDPGVPEELLPDGWPAREARILFARLHTRWSPAARRFVDAVIDGTAPLPWSPTEVPST